MKIPQNIRAVIFDLDGLLIDSEPIWDEAYYKFFEDKNIKEDFADEDQDEMGMGLREIVAAWKKKYHLQGSTEELTKEYRRAFYEIFFRKENFHLMEGANDLIGRLSGKYLLAVTTGGHTQEKCSQILKNLRINNYFWKVVSSDDVNVGKPGPDVYFRTAEKLNVTPNSCLVIEDSVNGVLAAKAAGMRVIGVNRDQKIRQELAKAGADEVYASLKDVQL